MPTIPIDDAKLLEEIQRMREALRSKLKTNPRIVIISSEWTPVGDEQWMSRLHREIYFMDFFRSFINRWSRRLTRRLRA